VNKRGAHFRYEKNYPPTRKVWTPTDLEAEKKELVTNRPLENNYDNAIFYNSETFFRALLGKAFPPETVIVYTSDHGQTLLHDRATHAGDSKPEALVPIFIIGSDVRLENADTKYRAAHRNLFATLLDLMNYPRELRPPIYAPSLFEAKAGDSAPREFFVGNPRGTFGGKKMLFDENEK
jgi:glucan phosphoethanolaminetransferase (alkaline phosphatase superfamily)